MQHSSHISQACLHPQRYNRGRVLSLATVGRIGYVPDASHRDEDRICDGGAKKDATTG